MLGYATRILSALLSMLFMATSIGACSTRDDPGQVLNPMEGVPSEKDRNPTALHILQSRPEISKHLQEAADRYAQNLEAPPNITVQTVGDPFDYRSALRSRLLAGEPADLFHLLSCADLGSLAPYLQDLSELTWVKNLILDLMTVDGNPVGLPYSIQGVGLVVNRRIFEAADIPLSGIHDFDTLSKGFRELQQKIDADALSDEFPELEAVLCLPGQSTEYLAEYTADLLLTGAFSSRDQAYRSDSLVVQEGQNAEAFLKLLIDVSTSRYGWSGITKTAVNQALENGIASGRTAAVLYDTDAWRIMRAVDPDQENDLSLIPIYFPDWEQGVVYTGSPAYWSVNAGIDPEQKQAAYSFLEWLYRSSEGAEFFARQFGAVSPFRDTAADTGFILHRQLMDAVAQGIARPQIAASAPDGWGETGYALPLQQYFTEYSMEWETLIASCQDDWLARRISE